jgi:uncharacterized protein YprB with RNaseH-like and TPR domain
MILSTFCHIKGVGPRLESRLWKAGIKDWNAALREENRLVLQKLLGKLPVDGFVEAVSSSLQQYNSRNLKALGENLQPSELWRLLDDFLLEALFLDIETGVDETGNQTITVLGTYKPTEGYHCFVYGRNREEFPIYFESHPLVVTFNGARFDLPAIKATFPGISEPQLHVDLFFTSRRAGLRGSLKKLEKYFGIPRDNDIDGLNGYDALKLWNAWFQEKDKNALELLIRYNRADTVNLKGLAEALISLIKVKLQPNPSRN